MNQETPDTTPPPRSQAMKAALLSALVVPGAGQLYNRQWMKGTFVTLLFLLCSLSFLFSITLAIVRYYINVLQNNLEQASLALEPLRNQWIHLLVLLIISIVLYIYSIIDAYKHAKMK